MKIRLTVDGKPRKNKKSVRTKALKRRYSMPGMDGLQALMTWRNADPLAAIKKLEATRNNKGRTPGHSHGVTLKTALRYRQDAQRDARKIVKYMKEKKIFEADNNLAEEALEAAVTVVRDKSVPVKDKLAASKLVLEYTQSKPVQKSDVNVHAAEAFLQGVLDDVKQEKADGGP
jgi:hypothetical protein